jgi:ATP-binding cassette, subfamily B, bacterial
VKLLTGLYRPTTGRILVDDVDLADIDIERWRSRLGGTFQDFVRLETSARSTVGVGDLQSMDDDTAIGTAIRRGGAAAVVERLPAGLDTHVGKTYLDGEELSGGQWQRLAVARGMMRATPVLLVLDEPTAALDPAAEHALYEEYGRTMREARSRGSITLFISHRFSSVRLADLIVVLDGGRVAEVGAHHDLLAANGAYAQMYRQQAAAYT